MSSAERTRTLVDQILRLRRAEDGAPLAEEIAAVREELEQQLGPTLSRGMTAQLLRVSQPTLDRWVAGGDIPTVVTPRGKIAVPAGVALELIEDVRSQGAGRRHPLATALRERRGAADEAERLVRRRLAGLAMEPAEGHGVAERRSLALHALVADRLDSRLVHRAKRALGRLEAGGRIDPRYARRWRDVLEQPIPQITELLTEDTQEARDLRQNTPFIGVLSEPERRAALSAVG